jgi:hypothetical protein
MPTELDDATIYQLGVLVAGFILLDQTITNLWIVLEKGGKGPGVRRQFMPVSFNRKVRHLKIKIKERFGNASGLSANYQPMRSNP